MSTPTPKRVLNYELVYRDCLRTLMERPRGDWPDRPPPKSSGELAAKTSIPFACACWAKALAEATMAVHDDDRDRKPDGAFVPPVTGDTPF